MKILINEELNYMKYLFGYQKGRVISEQYNPQLNPDGCEKEYYRDCATKTCVKKPKGSTIAYSKEEFDKKQEIYEFSKEHNRKGLHYIKVRNEYNKKAGWNYVHTPEKTPKDTNIYVGLPSGKEKVVKGKPTYYDGKNYDTFDITNQNPSDCTATVKLSSYENNLKKRDFKLSGMCVWICEGHYYPLLIISKPIIACIETPVPISATTVSSSGTTEPPVGPPPPIEDPKPIEAPKPTVNPNYPEYSLQYKKKKYLDVKLPKNKLKSVFDRGVLNTPGRFKISEKDPKEIARYVKYYEGYDDDQGNHIPGEIEKAQQQNRQIRFLEPVSNEDELAQQSYKEEYAEYKKTYK